MVKNKLIKSVDSDNYPFVVKVSMEISMQRISDLLCNGFEGGVGYWCRIEDYVAPTGKLPEIEDAANLPEYLVYPLTSDGAVILRDVEEYPVEWDEDEDAPLKVPLMRLDMQAIRDGLLIMADKYPRHFADFLSEDCDSETGDVFIQCCVLGDCIYG